MTRLSERELRGRLLRSQCFKEVDVEEFARTNGRCSDEAAVSAMMHLGISGRDIAVRRGRGKEKTSRRKAARGFFRSR